MGQITYTSGDIPKSWNKDRLKQELRARLSNEQSMLNRISELENALKEIYQLFDYSEYEAEEMNIFAEKISRKALNI